MLNRLTKIVDGLALYRERMKKNIEASFGLFYSQRLLLALTGTGLTREEAYAMVQKVAMQSWEREKPFRELVLADPEISDRLSAEKIEELFDLDYYLRKTDDIFQRVFTDTEGV